MANSFLFSSSASIVILSNEHLRVFAPHCGHNESHRRPEPDLANFDSLDSGLVT